LQNIIGPATPVLITDSHESVLEISIFTLIELTLKTARDHVISMLRQYKYTLQRLFSFLFC